MMEQTIGTKEYCYQRQLSRYKLELDWISSAPTHSEKKIQKELDSRARFLRNKIDEYEKVLERF